MDIRSIETCPPRLEHEGSTKVWWLSEARELVEETSGGHLELVSEFDVAPGAAVHPHSHPTYEYYYVLSGHGLMTVGDATREVVPGELVTIPPDVVHSLAPLGHAPIHCFCFAVGLPGAAPVDYTADGAGATTAAPAARFPRGGLDVRSIRDVEPTLVHHGTVRVWWLYAPRELYEATRGCHLELIDEWEVAGGGEVHPHAHPTHSFYYGLFGRGRMVIEGEERIIGPGDLVLIPPDAVHSIAPVTEHASLRCLCFAVGVAGSEPYDYSYDRSAAAHATANG
jgi:quercetin dioxygenase-like cupin family protein